MKPDRKVREDRDEAICKKVKEGYTYREVSKMYKISRQRVYQIFRKRYPHLVA
mgnify:FL=1